MNSLALVLGAALSAAFAMACPVRGGTPLTEAEGPVREENRWALTLESAQLFGVNNPRHLSNGGLSEPERRNTGLDAFGPNLGIHWMF